MNHQIFCHTFSCLSLLQLFFKLVQRLKQRFIFFPCTYRYPVIARSQPAVILTAADCKALSCKQPVQARHALKKNKIRTGRIDAVYQLISFFQAFYQTGARFFQISDGSLPIVLFTQRRQAGQLGRDRYVPGRELTPDLPDNLPVGADSVARRRPGMAYSLVKALIIRRFP